MYQPRLARSMLYYYEFLFCKLCLIERWLKLIWSIEHVNERRFCFHLNAGESCRMWSARRGYVTPTGLSFAGDKLFLWTIELIFKKNTGGFLIYSHTCCQNFYKLYIDRQIKLKINVASCRICNSNDILSCSFFCNNNRYLTRAQPA